MSVDRKEKENELKLTCIGDDGREISVTIPSEIVDLIQRSKGISVSVVHEGNPLFHCISNESLDEMSELLDESQLGELGAGTVKLISLA